MHQYTDTKWHCTIEVEKQVTLWTKNIYFFFFFFHHKYWVLWGLFRYSDVKLAFPSACRPHDGLFSSGSITYVTLRILSACMTQFSPPWKPQNFLRFLNRCILVYMTRLLIYLSLASSSVYSLTSLVFHKYGAAVCVQCCVNTVRNVFMLYCHKAADSSVAEWALIIASPLIMSSLQGAHNETHPGLIYTLPKLSLCQISSEC